MNVNHIEDSQQKNQGTVGSDSDRIPQIKTNNIQV